MKTEGYKVYRVIYALAAIALLVGILNGVAALLPGFITVDRWFVVAHGVASAVGFWAIVRRLGV